MPATFSTDGAFVNFQAGNDLGGSSTGIGVGSNASGPSSPGNFTLTSSDLVLPHIGGGATATGAGNTGQILQQPIGFTAGAGYVNGTYDLATTGGGVGAVQGTVRVVVSGGAITSATAVSPGGNFTVAPTVSLAALGGGAGGAVPLAVGLGSRVAMLGAGFGTNKGTQRLQAVGNVANGAAITPSTYLNRSGRPMVAGDQTWAVAP